MTDEQRQEFEAVTRPVIEWLNANGNPHMAIVIDPTSAVLYGGEIAYTTNDYLREKAAEADELRKDAERMRNALVDIADWTDRYTKPGHPISTVARAAIAQGKGE